MHPKFLQGSLMWSNRCWTAQRLPPVRRQPYPSPPSLSSIDGFRPPFRLPSCGQKQTWMATQPLCCAMSQFLERRLSNPPPQALDSKPSNVFWYMVRLLVLLASQPTLPRVPGHFRHYDRLCGRAPPPTVPSSCAVWSLSSHIESAGERGGFIGGKASRIRK